MQEAAEALFRSAVAVTGTTPDKVTTDKHASYPPALAEVFCDDLEHRTSKYLNNHLEQDHRGVKGRYRPMRGFQTHTSAARFCRAHDEVRDFSDQPPGARSTCPRPGDGDPCPEGRSPPRYARRRLTTTPPARADLCLRSGSGARPDGTPAAPLFTGKLTQPQLSPNNLTMPGGGSRHGYP